MKKISAKQYARALCEAAAGKKKDELNEVFDNFLRLIRQNKDWKNLPKITAGFARAYAEAEGLTEATITTARDIPAGLKKKIRDWLEKKTGKSVDLKTEVDKSLLGGLVIRHEDTIYDASLKTRVANLKKSFNN